MGHYASKCYADKKKKKYQDKEAHTAHEDSDSSEPLTLIVTITTGSVNSQAESWYLDLGCSNHDLL